MHALADLSLTLSSLFFRRAMGNVPSKGAPIHEAAAMDDVAKLRQLLAQGENVNAVDKVRVLLREARRAARRRARGGERKRNPACAPNLLAALSSPFLFLLSLNLQDGWSPVHYATYGGSIHALDELLSRGADPQAVDKAGRSPIHLAALRGSAGSHGTILARLLAARVPADQPDAQGLSPLHKAAVQGHVAVVEALLQAGANPNAGARDGSTPLHLAAHKGHAALASLLAGAGADPRRARRDGETPLHEAAEGGHAATCRVLLDLGALPGALDAAGQTPADDARAAGHGGLADALAALLSPAAAPAAYPAAVYQGGAAPVATQAVSNAVPFPGRGAGAAAAAPPGGREAAANASFWAAALAGGGGAGTALPTPLGRAPSVPAPSAPTTVTASEAGWWANLGQDPSQMAPPPATAPAAPAAPAAVVIIPPPPSGSREEFEAAVLARAQGLFRAAAGVAGGVGAALKGQAPPNRKPPASPAPAASDVKLDLEPFDDDDYGQAPAAPAEDAGDLGAHTYREKLAVQRRLAALEMEFDKAQGWQRGGTKADAKAARAARERAAAQERQIGALKRQLAVLVFGGGQQALAPVAAGASSAAAAPAPLYAPAGYTLPAGGSAFAVPRVPVEFVCPIAQTVMREPFTAADGVTYEQAAILAWLRAGHTQSPVTGAPLAHPGLTPNKALADAIRRFK